ncbi:MAG TPA: zinc-dependent alcohol dehydrogenase [Gemmatimonadaceae bacterium]|jgi:threonine dehydrogenase-like Zn-dependent dehydrogenase|nr:zinc-dependent alcohol dehydrogenase [Gemmatimonadaceae bacterium]
MKALCWYGKEDVRVEQVPDPEILNPGDAIVKITRTAICGSDLHLYDGYIPTMKEGDILGHEFMGDVVEVGKDVKSLRKGDRIVNPFTISCGRCWFCEQGLWSLCDNTNPNAWMVEAMAGFSGSGYFGYSHLFGGYAGGQAEFARIPQADHGPIKIPEGVTDDQALFLSDIFPTGYQAAERADIQPGHVVAIWGCGPVGQFAIRSAFLLGAERVIAIDRFPKRLELARQGGAETIDYSKTDDLVETLKDMTGGRGPDSCIDAVGMEAHGTSLLSFLDRAEQKVKLEFSRATALREVIHACRKGGTVSVIGVYAGFIDRFPFGQIFTKGLTIRAGQCDVQRYMQPLLQHIVNGKIDPTAIISHRLPLEQAPHGYDIFKNKQDDCTKVVLTPS